MMTLCLSHKEIEKYGLKNYVIIMSFFPFTLKFSSFCVDIYRMAYQYLWQKKDNYKIYTLIIITITRILIYVRSEVFKISKLNHLTIFYLAQLDEYHTFPNQGVTSHVLELNKLPLRR
jgi:hypothetical protein